MLCSRNCAADVTNTRPQLLAAAWHPQETQLRKEARPHRGEHPATPVWSRRHGYGWQDLYNWWIQRRAVSSVYVYDPQANAWTQLASKHE